MNNQEIMEKIQAIFDLSCKIEEDIWNDVPEEICKTIDEDQSLHYPQTEKDEHINHLYDFIKNQTKDSIFPLLDKLTIDDLYDICN